VTLARLGEFARWMKTFEASRTFCTKHISAAAVVGVGSAKNQAIGWCSSSSCSSSSICTFHGIHCESVTFHKKKKQDNMSVIRTDCRVILYPQSSRPVRVCLTCVVVEQICCERFAVCGCGDWRRSKQDSAMTARAPLFDESELS
jgi:hypothetical protein